MALRPIGRGPQKDTTRINDQIQAESVRVVDENGEMAGVMPPADALVLAEKAGLDLVEVSPNAAPPVCKILDYGKYRYEEQKRKAEAKKKQKVINIKEVKFRPGIEEHDFQVKLKQVRKFIEGGDKVKVTLRFRGREMAHQELGLEVLNRLRTEVEDIAKADADPKLEGRQMVMILTEQIVTK